MDERDHDDTLHITIDGMDQVIGLLKGNSQALNALLIGQQTILDAVKTLSEKEDTHFMAISDELAAVTASLASANASLDTIITGIAALDTLIQNFQNSPGTLSPADQAALDAIAAASSALATKAAAVDTAPPSPPTARK